MATKLKDFKGDLSRPARARLARTGNDLMWCSRCHSAWPTGELLVDRASLRCPNGNCGAGLTALGPYRVHKEKVFSAVSHPRPEPRRRRPVVASFVAPRVLGFEQALLYATLLHARQKRKGTTVPYVSHLLAVASLVMESGGGEEATVAALLHDAVEDQGGSQRLDEIRNKFGSRVADIVLACTDTQRRRKPPWRARKEAYLAHLIELQDPDALMVSTADKLHNARSLVRDHREVGDWLWTRFNADRDEQLWYYNELVRVLKVNRLSPRGLVRELADEVRRLNRRARTPGSPKRGSKRKAR